MTQIFYNRPVKGQRLISGFLLMQLILYFLAIGFSSQGGNSPIYQANQFIFYKILFLALPIFTVGWIFVANPMGTKQILVKILGYNKYFILYGLVAALMLPFALDWPYSAIRLFYTMSSFASLVFLITAYAVRLKSYEAVLDHLGFLFAVILLFPLYSLVNSGFDLSIPGFRNHLQRYNLVHPNIFASLCVQVLFVLMICRKNIKTIFLIVIYSLLIYLLFSRSVFISLALTAAILSVYSCFRYKSRLLLIVVLTLFFSVACIGLMVMTDMIQPVTLLGLLTRTDEIDSLYTLTNRSVLWRYLLEQIDWQVFLTGYGYSVIDRNYGVDFGSGILYGAHNGYLSVLLGSGIFSLIVMGMYFAGKIFYAHKKIISQKMQLSVLASLLFFLINCMASEEIGVNFGVTLAVLIFHTTIIQLSSENQFHA